MIAPSQRALRLTQIVLVLAAALTAAEAAFAAQLGRPGLLRVLPAAAALLLLLALRLAPARRVAVALAALGALLCTFGAEYALGRAQPRHATLAAQRGGRFDTRTRWEVIRDERRAGRDAYPAMEPSSRFTKEAGSLALGGISGKPTVFCNEGGAYTIYESDERGFANPRGLWGRGAVDVGILGEGFAQGACVPAGTSAADRIRARFPATLNLGMSGDGPLLELAGLVEHLAEVKPRVVLWFYYDKDLSTLEVEKTSPLLHRYLETGQRQGLSQDAVDRDLSALAAREEASAPTWPGGLASLGLTRASAPVWLQDLVMGEEHASGSALVRLDRLNAFAAARMTKRTAGAPPDLELYTAILRKAKALVASWGGTLHFVYLADLHQLRGAEHPNRAAVLAVAKEVGLPLIDVQPAFVAVPDGLTLRYNSESHCNEAGYQLIADTILAALPPAR